MNAREEPPTRHLPNYPNSWISILLAEGNEFRWKGIGPANPRHAPDGLKTLMGVQVEKMNARNWSL